MNYETRNDSVMQSVRADAKGAFRFVIPLKQPFLYPISVSDSALLQVLAPPGEKIALTINRDSIWYVGSQETRYLIDYESYRKKLFTKYLRRTYDSSAAAVNSGDKARIEYWNVEHEKASEQYKSELSA